MILMSLPKTKCQKSHGNDSDDPTISRQKTRTAMKDSVQEGFMMFSFAQLVRVTVLLVILGSIVSPAQAALEYVGGNSATGTSSSYSVDLTALTGGIDTAARSGDLVIVVTGFATNSDGNPGISSPADYAELADLYSSDTHSANGSFNWKIMGATPDTSVTVNGSGDTTYGSSTVVHVWRGADPTTPIDVLTTTDTGTNSPRSDSPSITPVTSGAVVLTAGVGARGSSVSALTEPTGYSNALSVGATSGSSKRSVTSIASKLWTSGAEDPAAWTGGSLSFFDSWVAASIAIRPQLCSAIAVPLAATAIGSSTINLSWSSDAGTTQFDLYRSTVTPVNTANVANLVASNVSSPYADNGLLPSTTYYYRLLQTGTTACTVDSDEGTATTPVYTPDTTVGTMAFPTVKSSSITVAVPYTGDDNEDNSCTLAWGTVSSSYPNSITAILDRGTRTCRGTAAGLTASTTYYFQATFSETNPDTVTGSPASGSAVTTVNYLMHNSGTLGTRYGTWGMSFTCATCHEINPANGNIKRVKASIATPNGGTKSVTFQTAADGTSDFGDDSDAHTASNRICEVCHTQTYYHRDDTTAQGGALTHFNGADCIRCHKHSEGFRANGECATCHADGSGGAPLVSVANGNTHLDADGGGATWAAGDCTGCHNGHSGSVVGAGVDVELPPANWTNATGESHVTGDMKTALGFGYLTRSQAIHLSGPNTATTINSKGTEAEICWGCHDANGIGELTSGAGATYKFGVLADAQTAGNHVSDWTTVGAWRQDAYDSRLTRPIASVHTVNMNGVAGHSSSVADNLVTGKVKRGTLNASLPGNAAGQGDSSAVVLEDKQYIRCSYCHDVHSLNMASGDTVSVAPYLRGTWLSDPYPTDVPPTANQIYSGADYYFDTGMSDGMPRPKATSVAQGGYFIDQNSGNPTSGQTLATSAGLCSLCHGTNVDTMDYYTGGTSLWVGTNGHSNAALGGSGSSKVNLFDARRGATYYMALQGSPSLGGEVNSNSPAWGRSSVGFRSKSTANSGYYGGTVDSTTPGGDYSAWYSASGIGGHTGTAGDPAHEFSCSKCHSPHATGLPALLKTNCLDTEISGWTNPNKSTVNYGAAQANNCHRKTTNNIADLQNSGWNVLAPKQ